MRVTVKDLEARKACTEEVVLFRETFPRGAKVTEANLLKAVDAGLDLEWWAAKFLPAPLRAKYRRQKAPLLAEYQRQEAPLRAKYQRQVALLWAEYERQKARLIWALVKEEA